MKYFPWVWVGSIWYFDILELYIFNVISKFKNLLIIKSGEYNVYYTLMLYDKYVSGINLHLAHIRRLIDTWDTICKYYMLMFYDIEIE